jgi:hypothetical protein
MSGNGCAASDDACPVEAKSGKPFDFHVRNLGSSEIALRFGCSKDPPVEIDTPNGALGIGPESADDCGNTCQPVLDGVAPLSCSDCGPGITPLVAPGERRSSGPEGRGAHEISPAPLVVAARLMSFVSAA